MLVLRAVLSVVVQDDEVVLQCSATINKEQQKLCLAAEGFGNRLCFLESTSNSKVSLNYAAVLRHVVLISFQTTALENVLQI